MNKRILYESIMKDVSNIVKNKLNENVQVSEIETKINDLISENNKLIKQANETIYSLIKENYTLHGKIISNSIKFSCNIVLSSTKIIGYICVEDNNGNVNITFRFYRHIDDTNDRQYITDINEYIEIIKHIDKLNEQYRPIMKYKEKFSRTKSATLLYYNDYKYSKDEKITGTCWEELFVKFYKLNNRLRYCNGSYYEWKNSKIENEYSYWLRKIPDSMSFELYYGNGVVD